MKKPKIFIDVRLIIRLLCSVVFSFNGLIYAQNTDNNDYEKLFIQFENELLFSHKNAQTTAKFLIEKASLDDSDKSKALIKSVKAIKFLKIEKQLDSAILYANAAYKSYKALKDSVQLFRSTHTLYEYYNFKSQRDSMFLFATKEIELAEKLNNPIFKTISCIDMSDAYYLTKQHDKVLTYRKKALHIAKKHQLKKELADIHIKIAQSHLRLSRQRTQKALDSAIYHGKKALNYAKEVNYKYGIYESTVRLADFLTVDKQHKKALSLIETVVKLPQEERPSNFNYTTSFYYAVILKDNKQYDKAKNIVKKLLAGLKKDDYEQRLGLSFFLSVLYAYNQQPDSTDVAIKQAVIANNALAELKTNEKIAELQTKYETEKKQQHIENLEQKKRLKELEVTNLERQRLILLYSLIIPITFLIAGGWYVNRRRLKLQLEAEQKEYAKQMSELKALRSQMNPHFIFNAMNSIQEYIFANEKKLASSYLVKFSRLIRIYLEQSRLPEITLTKEIEALDLYLELENNRFGNQLNYLVDVDEDLDFETTFVPSLFIQPYVENAIKHGLLHKNGEKKLSIKFKRNRTKNQMIVTIKDNGIGRKASIKHNENRPYKSFSTEANLNRIELINAKRSKKLSVKFNDLTDEINNALGTEVIITIPLTK